MLEFLEENWTHQSIKDVFETNIEKIELADWLLELKIKIKPQSKKEVFV